MIDLKFSELIRLNNELKKSLTDREKIEVRILSNITVNQLTPVLEYVLRREDLNVDLNIGDYDNILQDSSLIDGHQIPIIIWELCNLKDSFAYEIEIMSEAKINSYFEKTKNELEILFNNLKNSKIVLFNKYSHLNFTSANLKISNFEQFVNAINRFIEKKLPSNFVLIDIDKVIAKIGIDIAFDQRNFYTNKTLYTLDFMKAYGQYISPIILSLFGKTKKALIFDCDNTLWKGILGEDGLENIQLSNKHKYGIFFKEVQLLAKSLVSKGIILGLCSKNNAADVDEVIIKRTDMTLADNDIVVKKVNWENKASNLVEIAADLNIGIDSLVFVDDSKFELNLIKDTLPQIKVIEVPEKLYEYPKLLQENLSFFYTSNASQEDLNRVAMYKQNLERDHEKKSFETIDEYLKSLDITIELSVNDPEWLERIAQMTQKTNQFNLTTRRYSENDINGFYSSPNYDVIGIEVSDKFGNSGITGMCVINYDYQIATIDTLLMSCRILGRNIEISFLNEILARLYAKGVTKIKSTYIKTPKNGQVENFYDNNGFKLLTFDETQRNYELDFDIKNNNQTISYIKVLWKKK